MASAVLRDRGSGRLLAICILIALALPSLAGSVVTSSPAPEAAEGHAAAQQFISSTGASYHVATASEVEQMMRDIGVGSGDEAAPATGLAPPTLESWRSLVGKLLVLDSAPSDGIPSSVDLSTDPCFPVVGNQGSQGSCAAWAATYYCYGYLEAKDNGWIDAKTGNLYHLMSPAWTYNKVNGGTDDGSWMIDSMRIICDWGCASLGTMPYNAHDVLSWGSAAAFREAPLNRALAPVTMSCNSTDWTVGQIKAMVAEGTPVTFAINHANVFYDALLDDNYVTAAEYHSTNMTHAQTIVGYDDAAGAQGDVGAFRVVNSWGSSGTQDHTDHGYYWITYAAMKTLLHLVGGGVGLCYIEDRPDYTPSLIGVWHYGSAPGRDGMISVGVQGTENAQRTLYYAHDTSLLHRMPTFMCVDVTDFGSEYESVTANFTLTLGRTGISGSISSFRVERYGGGYQPGAADQISPQSGDVPATNPATVFAVLPQRSSIGYDEGLDTTPHDYSSASVSRWVGTDNACFAGSDAIQSGDTADSDESSLTVRLTGPGTFGFCWRVSSEADHDYLRLNLDGSPVASISGSLGWRLQNLTIGGGEHDVTWTYSKDSSNSVGEDAGYVDRLMLMTSPDDRFEENDDVSHASSISPGIYAGLECYDEDWYGISMTPGFALFANVTFSDAVGDLDLLLVAPGRTRVLDISETSADTESVTVIANEASDYYVLVRGADGNVNSYTLELSVTKVVDDLGELGSVTITGGTSSFDLVSSTVRVVEANCGDVLAGTLTLSCQNPWPDSVMVPLIVTPSWGDPSLSYATVVPSLAEGVSVATVDLSLTVPSEIGDYYLIAAFRTGSSAAYVASATSSTDPAPTWGDGNDVAVLSPDQIAQAQGSGRTTAEWLAGGSYGAVSLPCDVLKIRAGITDATPPTTVIELDGDAGDNGWFVSAVGVTLHATDPGGQVSVTMCRVDGGPWTVYLGPFVVGTEGVHEIDYYSTDTAANFESVNRRELMVDLVGPVFILEVEGEEGSNTWYLSNVSFGAQAVDETSGVADLTYSVDNGSIYECTGAFAVAGDGRHDVRLFSRDRAGNEEESDKTILIDTTPPATGVSLGGPEGSPGWYGGEVSANLTSSDAGSNVEATMYRLDGGAWTVCTSVVTVTAEGPHLLEYFSRDAAGNNESVRSVAFTIDTLGPITNAVAEGSKGSDGWYLGPVTVVLEVSDESGEVSESQCRLDMGGWTLYSAPLVVSGEGSHEVEFRSIDLAGNVGPVGSMKVRTDTVAPVVSMADLAPTHSTDGSASVYWYLLDSTSGIDRTEVIVDGVSLGFYSGHDTVRIEGLVDGAHNVTIAFTDVAGNSETVSMTLTVDKNPLSPTGPCGPLIDILFIAALAAVAVLLLALRKRT